MRLFRLRPVIVRTVQATGFNHDEVRAFVGEHRYRLEPREAHRFGGRSTEGSGVIARVYNTRLDAWLGIQVGDWVEQGAAGDFSPVRPQDCAARYAPLAV